MSVRHRKLEEVKPTIKACLVRFRRLQLHTIHALFMADTFFYQSTNIYRHTRL